MSRLASTQSPESLASPEEPQATRTPPGNVPGQGLSSVFYRLTVRQFDRMIDDGIIPEADRVELVEGLVVTKMGRNRPHVQAGVRGLRLEIYSDPGSAGYQSTQILKSGEDVPVVIDGALVGQIAVSDLLPPREKRASGGES